MGLRNRDLPPALMAKMEGPKPPDDFESDGCSCAFNVLLAVDTRPACHWHDWHYRTGKLGRLEADRVFFRNSMRCGLGKFWSRLRYFAVRLFGWRHFKGEPS